MTQKKFNTDRNFWQRSVIFYNNQIQALKNMPSSSRVQSLIAENQKELTRVTKILNGCYAK